MGNISFDSKRFTEEELEVGRKITNVKELVAYSKLIGKEIPEEEAETIVAFNKSQAVKQDEGKVEKLSDNELENMSGGCSMHCLSREDRRSHCA